ncbi:probable RNA-binding protein 19 isoform X2 [Dendronephthya gigantea]|uniref:probable RNA-binding protein 19 isoform X2 n=1 Tax=Dendronephthya gigantea TaxID=151771 RepID=UPI00106C7843|nr:probable RNA-binding protein 19 isoform X2 [Dendronephthya gigantea]
MSRLIVKNLPKNITEERVRSIFEEMGQITDLKLKFTKNGVFRRFAFIGFKTHTEAQRALKHFNNTFIDISKIQVDVCKDLGDESVPRPWSKYSEKSSAFQKKLERTEKRKKELDGKENGGKSEEVVEIKKKKKGSALLSDELENDSSFQEFLEVHKSRSLKKLWSNDELVEHVGNKEKQVETKEKLQFEDSSDDNNDDESNNNDEPLEVDIDELQTGSKEATNVALSDMDYLKKKVHLEKKVIEGGQKYEVKDKKRKKVKDDDMEKSEKKAQKHETKTTVNQNETNDDKSMDFERKSEFTIKLRGLPFHAKKTDIEEFLSPLKTVDIRLPKDSKNRPSGRAYVDLESKEALKKALKRHKDYIKGRYIEVFEDKRREMKKNETENEPPWIENAKELAENKDLSIAETGRLYLRNLSYACTEEELLELFSKYGPTTEVFVPIDKNSNQSMGFAFVTFMMPEHAVEAFNELDGHVFQGRLLHILPAKPKRGVEGKDGVEKDGIETSSFKKRKTEKVASLKAKDHNWNALFLGVNAVAEIMADRYKSNKSDVLDVQSKGGLALRMALGETQVVAETREFLMSHGVKLDAFGQPDAKRSKTVIIVKNLQHDTKLQDLENLFKPFGHLSKLVLPPSGVTALVAFEKLSSAAKAFEKLAYTKFNNVPLYLEWAPADVFDVEQPSEATDEKVNESDNEKGSDSDKEADGHVIFVKNLNFDTKEDSLKELFSGAGKVSNVTIAKKKDSRNKGAILSMGYGFVEYKTKKSAMNAIKTLQNYELDGHNLELKMSNKKQTKEIAKRKTSSVAKQKSSKILVRNVPFEATQKELRELFGTFGELKTVRLPKKLSGTGPHRGFAFIDFLTKQDAKRAFKSLCTSTHLYGRRLVLEWADDSESIDELRKKTADYFHEPKKKVKVKDLAEELDGQ